MTAPVVAEPVPQHARLLPAPLILLCGLLVVPKAIGLAANSWSAPDAAAYVRMAFASVAGIVVALASVLVLLVDRLVKRAPAGSLVALAVVMVVWGAANLDSAVDLLLQRLATVS